MKKIKFRAWDKILKRMIIPTELNFYGNGELFAITKENSAFTNLEQWKLMQYTGLHDKNGKEIYESDILKCQHGDIFEIIFVNGAFVMDFNKDLKEAYLFDKVARGEEKVEVIGNIYENPSLLKGEPSV